MKGEKEGKNKDSISKDFFNFIAMKGEKVGGKLSLEHFKFLAESWKTILIGEKNESKRNEAVQKF